MYFAAHATTKTEVEEGTSSAGGERLPHCVEHEPQQPHIAALMRRVGLRREKSSCLSTSMSTTSCVEIPRSRRHRPHFYVGMLGGASRPGTSSRSAALQYLASNPSPSCRRPANAARPNPSVNATRTSRRLGARGRSGLSSASRPKPPAAAGALPQTLGVSGGHKRPRSVLDKQRTCSPTSTRASVRSTTTRTPNFTCLSRWSPRGSSFRQVTQSSSWRGQAPISFR